MIPLTTRKADEFEANTFGFLNTENQFVLMNVMTKDINQFESRSENRKLFLNRMALNSLQTMMSSLVTDMKNTTEDKYMKLIEVLI